MMYRASLISTTAVTAATGVHHVFRLGLPTLIPALIVVALPIASLALYASRGKRLALYSYLAVTAFAVVWFGVIDGYLDHVLKAIGVVNLTFLPGGDEPVVPTVYSLWSPPATALFYESTGVLTAIASVPAVYFAWRLYREATGNTTSP